MVVQAGLCRKGFVMVRSSEASGWLSRATTRFTTLAARLFIPLRFILSDIPELADVRLRHGNLVLLTPDFQSGVVRLSASAPLSHLGNSRYT